MNYARFELHLHLDGSLNLKWAYNQAIETGVIDPSTTFESYYETIYFTGYKSREEGFKKFELTCAVLQSKKQLHDATYDLGKLLYEQGIYYAEIRFASQQHCLKGLTQLEALKAVCDGAEDAMKDFDIELRIINCVMHKGENALSNMRENFETVEVVRQLLPEGIVVGLDLAGFENNGDYKLYGPVFEKAREYGIPYTLHAGEMGVGEHVADAIEMGANRIGHGIFCVENEEWLNKVVETQIPLEVCVTSNCKTREYAKHPIVKLMAAGAKITINSDNMMFSRTNNCYEHYMLKLLGVSDEQLIQCGYNSIEAAFCDEKTKKKLKEKYDNLVQSERN